jgi:enoyl-CoA hydratase/carnithine racemase
MSVDLQYLKVKSGEGVCWIQFHRPEKLNAINSAVLEELETALIQCENDEQVRVVVLTGNEKAFVAGADIDHMAKASIGDAYRLTDLTMRVQNRLGDFPKPTIAAISGYALGGGCEIALCCDFRIASDTALFGLPEITLGIIPGGGGTQRLTRLVNLGVATKMILLGEKLKAPAALEAGLVDWMHPQEALEAEVNSLCGKLIRMPAMALRAAKTAMRKGMGCSLADGLCIEQDLFAMLFGTEDQKEGMAAFIEKRRPEYQGK